MIKRKEFITGAAVGLAIAAAATAGGVLEWPAARAQPMAPADALLVRTQGPVVFSPPPGAPMSFADIVDAVSPAVVSIDVRQHVSAESLRELPGFGGLPFDLPQPEGQPGEQDQELPEQMGSGSGFFISADGYIVTNNHVVANAEEITVRLTDDRELPATLVGTDPETDLAVIRVEGHNFPFVRFETDARPRVGDWVLAIGNPLGLGGTVTAGVVSAYGRQIDQSTTPYVDYMQIDAPINRGNSGGPTFDIHGRVIGVNSAIYSPNGYSVGIGFAIPADVADRVTRSLIAGGAVERGYVGISIGPVTNDVREALNLPEGTDGARVTNVNAGGPAARGGLLFGDIVTAVDGQDIDDANELTRHVGAVRVGETIVFDVLRGGRHQQISVRADARPSANELAALNAIDRDREFPQAGSVAGDPALGMTVRRLDGETRQLFGIAESVAGLVVTDVRRGTVFARRGFEPGVVIVRADNRPVSSAEELSGIIAELRRSGRPSVLLDLSYRGQPTLQIIELNDIPVADSGAGG